MELFQRLRLNQSNIIGKNFKKEGKYKCEMNNIIEKKKRNVFFLFVFGYGICYFD